MKKLAVVCLAFTVFLASEKLAKAGPGYFQLFVTTDTSLDLTISIIGETASTTVPLELTGTMNGVIDVVYPLGPPITPELQYLTNVDIDISDQTINLPAGFLGGISAELSGAGIKTLLSGASIPLNQTVPTNPSEYTFDPGGGSPSDISIDDGLFTYLGTGAVGGLIGSGTTDFSTTPFTSEIPSMGQVGLMTQYVETFGYGAFVTISAPITFSDALMTDPIDMTFDVSGVLVITGFIVPEPSSIVLLGIALLGLIPLRRRFSRSM